MTASQPLVQKAGADVLNSPCGLDACFGVIEGDSVASNDIDIAQAEGFQCLFDLGESGAT